MWLEYIRAYAVRKTIAMRITMLLLLVYCTMTTITIHTANHILNKNLVVYQNICELISRKNFTYKYFKNDN